MAGTGETQLASGLSAHIGRGSKVGKWGQMYGDR